MDTDDLSIPTYDGIIKEAQKQTKDQAVLTSHLRKIIHEDRELLEKLAQ